MAERRYTTIFAFAVLTAGVATFGIYRVLQTSKARNRIQTQPVVVAMLDVGESQAIDRTAVAVAQWPVGTVPAGAFTNIDSVVGRVTRVDVFKGEVIVPGRLAPSAAATCCAHPTRTPCCTAPCSRSPTTPRSRG